MGKEKLERKIKDYLKNHLIASKTNYTGICYELRIEKLISFSLEYDRTFKNKFDAFYISNNIGKKILFRNNVLKDGNIDKDKQNGLIILASILADLELGIQEFETRILIKE
jgi:hypothetical protein